MARPHPVRAILDERGITVTAFADSLHYARPHLSRILNGSLPAPRRVRLAIALYLELPESELWLNQEQECLT